MIIKIKVGSNTVRHDDMIDTATATPRQLFEKWGVDYNGKQANLNGKTLFGDDLDKKLCEFGLDADPTKISYLAVVAKHDNAAA